MNAIILAAGFGTRLRPWTDTHPKALVPVGNTPMLERVITRLEEEGFNRIVINTHHFASQIEDFVIARPSKAEILLSHEPEILNTGGGVLKALGFFSGMDSPVLVHNVDILSDAPLAEFYKQHIKSGRSISLLTSGRESKRKLIFDENGFLQGWHNLISGEYLPESYKPQKGTHESAFSGIYVLSKNVMKDLKNYADKTGNISFPVIDFFMTMTSTKNIGEKKLKSLNLIDIGKPETLAFANSLFEK